mgnify:CR=1 FL=1
MLTIRFKKEGKKHQKIMRLIVVDSHLATNSGSSKEILGWVNPYQKEERLNKERILYWLSKGAKPSASVFNLLVKNNIIAGKKIPKHKKVIKQDNNSAAKEAEAQVQSAA